MEWTGKTGTRNRKEFTRQSQVTDYHLMGREYMGNISKSCTMHVEET